MFDQLANQALQGIILVLGALISLACGYVALYLNRLALVAKTEAKAIESSSKEELVNGAIDRFKDLALIIVGKIEQTTAKQLREQVAAGTASREQLIALSQTALTEILNTAEPALISAVQSQIKDIQNYTLSLIENAVVEVKARSAANGGNV
jgi:hypothetical protein